MLDIKLLRESPELIAQNLEDRNFRIFPDLPETGWGEVAVQRLRELDRHYRDVLQESEDLRRRQNESSGAMKAVAKLPKEEQAAKRAELIEEGRQLRERGRELEEALSQAMRARDEAWAQVPNLTHPESPRGNNDEAHREVQTWGTPRDFEAEGFEAQDHLQIGERLDLIDFASGAKVAGQKFYFLKNEAVLLDMALQNFALQVALKHGFILHTTPDLARSDVLLGLGYNPRGESTQVYTLQNSDLCLVGTAEITLGGMLSDEIIEAEKLPLYICGLSHCFRTEAGSHGQESKGLYRVHQFTKVELFAVTEGHLEHSEAAHAKLLAMEEEIFQALELPYRVLDMASGDLAGPAYRKYDIEVWMPGRQNWGEVTSTSNCTDYQARRLRVRYRPAVEEGAKSKPRVAHMLNGTAVATSRAIVGILENGQQADGSVKIPQALVPWMGMTEIRR